MKALAATSALAAAVVTLASLASPRILPASDEASPPGWLKNPGGPRFTLRIFAPVAMCVLVALMGKPANVHGASATPAPSHLRSAGLKNPLGIDRVPGLSWTLPWPGRNRVQSAYQIIVASSQRNLAENHGDLWNSGRVRSGNSVEVRYGGKTLHSGEQCFWKIRAWDENGAKSPWSKPAHWSMGLLRMRDWKAQWIGWGKRKIDLTKLVRSLPLHHPLPAFYFRRQFTIHRPIRRAVIYMCGLGWSRLYINGHHIGYAVRAGEMSWYPKRCYYVTYDVTHNLTMGRNAIGVVLGNGRYYAPRLHIPVPTVTFGRPRLLLQMVITYRDGTQQLVTSNGTWKITDQGPIEANNEYDGEIYDSRRQMPGWDRSSFVGGGSWKSAALVHAPGGTLRAQMIQPLEVMKIIHPLNMVEIAPGKFIFDMGQDLGGWCRLTASGPAGTMITIRYADCLQKNGQLNMADARSAQQTDRFILNGDGEQDYAPHFTYHAFQYVEVTGFPGKPSLDSIEGLSVHDNIATIGGFACSKPLINKIYRACVSTIANTYRSFPTDDDTRDERQGWFGDVSHESRGEAFIFNNRNLYAKWMTDARDCQRPDGSISDVNPAYWSFYNDDVTWPSTFIISTGMLYRQFDDLRPIRCNYPAMKRWILHMEGYLKNNLISRDTYGDWCAPPFDRHHIHSRNPANQTSGTILATTCFYGDLRLMMRYALLLNKPSDTKQFSALAAKMKVAYNAALYNAKKGVYGNGSETSSIVSLAYGMVPESRRKAVFNNLVNKILVARKGHVGTGLIGGQWLMRTLSRYGRPDVAYRLITNTTYPSWGYMIQHGATNIWELWNGNTANASMSSRSHIMLIGDLVLWLYEDVAGIKPDWATPGFKHVIMDPHPIGDLRFVNAWHRSPYGRIVSDWRVKGHQFTWRVVIPANSSATVYVPASGRNAVEENGVPISQSKNVKFLRIQGRRAVFEIGSGSYDFVSDMVKLVDTR
jgi:alpha-L-rhamnosidase